MPPSRRPTALSLIATEFPEGKERNRAMGVYAAMSGAGAAVGLILGGFLTEIDWRWVMFVNVPIGIFIALVAPRALTETERHTGKFDLPGAITATLGLVILVYGTDRGSDQRWRGWAPSEAWTDPRNLALLGTSIVLLVVFVFIEARSRHALMPLRILENRNRAGAYGVMLIIGAAMFGMFFYLTQFVQGILGYSPIKAGFAFVPVSVCIIISAGIASQLITRFGAKPFAMLGTAMTAIGMLWLAQIQPDSTYVGGLLGPMIVFALGLGFTFMPLTLAAVSQIDESDAGIASGVLNTSQQIGGSIGLAALTTVFATVFANTMSDFASSGAALTPDQLAGAEVTATVDGWTAAFQVSAWPGHHCLHHHRLRHQGDQGRGSTRRPGGRRALGAPPTSWLLHWRYSRSGSPEPLRLPPLPGAVVGVLVLRSSHQRNHLGAQLRRRSVPGQRWLDRLPHVDTDRQRHVA